MPEIKPRFEFRAFAPDFGIVAAKMRRLSPVEKIRESLETYIISAGNNVNNTKIRANLLDIKVFVRQQQGLEQWNPRMKGEFPMSAQKIRNDVFPAFSVDLPEFKRENYSLKQYLDELIRPHPDLVAVNVFKRRFAFTINNCITEIGEVYVNGAKIMTASLESVDVDAILQAKEMVELSSYENVNYLLAIKRIIGLAPLPADSVFRANY